MSYVVAFKCHCQQQIDAENTDRIVTEACGHSKCRECFIKEVSGCVKCLTSNVSDDQHRSMSAETNDIIPARQTSSMNQSDVVNIGTGRSISNPKDIRILEEVIIKPFVDISSNDNSHTLAYPRINDFQKFKYPSHILRRSVDGKTEFECKICKKSFRSKSNRKYHLYCDETIEKPFNCTTCSKTFATKNHLDYHENRHKNIQHKCNDCDRTFMSRVSLQKHSKIHSNEFKFICDHCDKRYHHKSELILHMFSHKKSPLPFQCDVCDKSFAAKFKLNQHKETHKGVKSHSCQHCDKKFTRNSSLTIHMLTHSEVDKKFECNLCSKSFDRQRSHDRHMKIKHGSTEFRCPLCDVQSGRKDNILRHIRNLHSDANFDDIVKQISKTVARINVSGPVVQPIITAESTKETITVNEPSNVCQYQSVIQFAARSKTPTPVPIDVTDDVPNEVKSPINVPNDNSIVKNNSHDTFDKELRIDLTEPNDSEQKISNINIYRQLLSPYLRPPPNLDCINGTQEQCKRRVYAVQQRDHLPIRKENVDIYRSILLCTTDQEQHQTVISRKSDTDLPLSNGKAPLVIHGQSAEYFSEMHWRKRTSQCFNQMEQ